MLLSVIIPLPIMERRRITITFIGKINKSHRESESDMIYLECGLQALIDELQMCA